MAFDHRSQLEDMALQCGASLKRIPALKQLILQASREAAGRAGLAGKAGLLHDGTFGQDALNAITGEGWWIGRPIELPGSRPLEMEHGNIGTQLISWPQEHVVKCLVFFHPEDAHGLRTEQEQKIAKVYHACCQSGHELLLEVILPATMPRSDGLYLRAISASTTSAFTPTGGSCRAAFRRGLDGTERDYRTPGPALPRGGDPRHGCPCRTAARRLQGRSRADGSKRLRRKGARCSAMPPARG